MATKKGNGMTTFHFFRAELRESFQDAGTVLIFIVAALLYPMVYSVGYVNETIRNVPIALVDLDHTSMSRQFGRMLDATEQVSIACHPGSIKEAEQLFYQQKIHGVILIPASFEKQVLSGNSSRVTVYCDAGRFLVYKQVFTAATYVTGMVNAGVEVRSSLVQGKNWNAAVTQVEKMNPQVFDVYNPSSGYATFIVPGILIIIIQQSLLVGIGLLYGKHNEQKYRPDLVPANTWTQGIRVLLGKSMAYTTLYLVTTLVTLVLFYHWLRFPDLSGIFAVYPLLVMYLFTISFMGLAVCSWFTKRVQALMFLVFLSPVVYFLTGVPWPLDLLPHGVRWLGYLFPTTPMLPAFIKLRIMGGGWESVKFETMVLCLQMTGYFILALVSYKVVSLKQGRKEMVSEPAQIGS